MSLQDNPDESAQLRLLREVAEATALAIDSAELAAKVASLVRHAVGADVCFVHRVDQEKRQIVLIGATPPFDQSIGRVHLSIGEGVSGWVSLHGEPAVVVNKWEDSRYVYLPELHGEDYQGLISVPMMRPAHRVVGVINAHWKYQIGDISGKLSALMSVSHLLAGAMEIALLHEELARREAELSRVAALVIDAGERERRRVAADIHDGIGQVLLSLLYHLDATLDPSWDQRSIQTEIREAQRLANGALDEVRRTMNALRPAVVDDFGLVGGLDHLASSYPSVEIALSIDDVPPLVPSAEVALYRICQEALNNVVKHSNAQSVGIHFHVFDSNVILRITDDGDGFAYGVDGEIQASASNDGYGLIGMKERAETLGGQLEIFTRAELGTTIVVRVPLATSTRVDEREPTTRTSR
jgi:signal transduction histidine kinase